MRRLRVLIWHVHGSYLYYLTHSRHEFYVPSKPSRDGDYIGKWGHIPWPDNMIDVPAEDVRRLDLDCVIYQRPRQYLVDRFEILSEKQRRLPTIYLEHDPPAGHPTNTYHLVDDPNALTVQVTHYNDLMWDCRRTPTRVIEHGVVVPEGLRYSGKLDKGLVVINHLARRGRQLGIDIYERVAERVPLDLVGMEAERVPGGIGEVRHDLLPEFEADYRFFFNPIRYTSFGLAVCEAMMIGMPIVGLATTEMPRLIENGYAGYLSNNVEELVDYMKSLINDPLEARRLGEGAREIAMERFNIRRFVDDWERTLAYVTGIPESQVVVSLNGAS